MILNIFSKKKKIDENFLEQLEEDFIRSDIGMIASNNIINKLRKTKVDEELSYEELKEFILNILQEDITPYFNNYNFLDNIKKAKNRPFVTMFCGINGVGKTTSIAKVAKILLDNKFKVLLVPADTFRTGAQEQLKLWSEKLGCEFFSDKTKQPAALVYKSLEYALNNQIDVVLIDTAGRVDNNASLMDELTKIAQTMKKVIPSAPHNNIIVLDGTSGQVAASQARNFAAAINIDGVILTKLDSNAKGGFIINIIKSLHCPIYFIGNGETENNITSFNIAEFLKNLVS